MISVSTVPNNSFIFAAFFTILNGYAFFSKKTIILSQGFSLKLFLSIQSSVHVEFVFAPAWNAEIFFEQCSTEADILPLPLGKLVQIIPQAQVNVDSFPYKEAGGAVGMIRYW